MRVCTNGKVCLVLQDANSKPENLSIADELKQAAEEAVQETGYVYDESSGLYYDKNSGYYYDHVSLFLIGQL